MARPTEHDVVYGVHPVEEALQAGRRCLQLFVRDETAERREVVRLARAQGVPVHRAGAPELARLAHGGNHQGVVALFAPFAYADFNRVLADLAVADDALVIVLDSVTDAGNLGAILRTAAAAGAHAVVIPQDRSARVTPAAVRASAGAADRIPVVRVVNLARALGDLKKAGCWVYGADMAGQPVWKTDLRGKVALVLGGEEKGLRRLVAENCDAILSIPMPGRFESLNVGAAAAVLIFEAVRQRTSV